jgi:hypothetical protein
MLKIARNISNAFSMPIVPIEKWVCLGKDVDLASPASCMHLDSTQL